MCSGTGASPDPVYVWSSGGDDNGPVNAMHRRGSDPASAEHSYATIPQTSQPVPVFQLVTRRDPPVGADVRPIPLSLRNEEGLLFERGIDVCHETVCP